jgi:hypothetical protein
MAGISLQQNGPIGQSNSTSDLFGRIVAQITMMLGTFAAAQRVSAALNEGGKVSRADLAALGIREDNLPRSW